MADERTQKDQPDDTPALPGTTPEGGEPAPGDNQDVAAEKIYPDDPTGADPA
jgi:hypothetical protein